MQKAAGVVIGLFAFAIAGAALYGINNLNETIQAKPNQIQVSNYSAQIGSLQPQINSINNNVSSLSTLKGDLSDIRGKLTDLESKINNAQQISVSKTPVIISTKTNYLPGEILNIVAVGFEPQKSVQIQLLDYYGFVIMQKDVLADTGGRVVSNVQIPSSLVPGSFQVKLVSGQLAVSQSVIVTRPSPSSFTAQTDKSVYQSGEQIEVYGRGIPNTSVTATLTFPSGTTSTGVSTVRLDGTYMMFFSASLPSESGIRSIAVENQGMERILYITVQSGIFSPSTFTAQPSSIVYQAGDIISISGTGSPNTSVVGVLTSPSGLTYSVSTTTGSDGTYLLSDFITNSYEKGNWYITLSNQGQTRQVFIFIGPVSSSGGSFSFTAQTDKTIYQKGSLIRISGTGPPFASVSTTLTSPSGNTYNGAAIINFDGSYNVSYSALPSFESGNWHITLAEGGQLKVISIFLEP